MRNVAALATLIASVWAILGIPKNIDSARAPLSAPINAQCGSRDCTCTECDLRCRCCILQEDEKPEMVFEGSKSTCGCDCQDCNGGAKSDECHCRQVESAKVVGGFNPGGPVKDGVRATVDLPTSQHMKNTGGIGPRGPGSGSGLCVFTSIEHSSRWQNVTELSGFQKWMMSREGGGWPEKVDKMLSQFCSEKGKKAPEYVQHTGGDEAFLELALATGRFPAVTYAGRDDFYSGRIAHMVNLAYMDADKAAIVDNNRPGVWVWMTRNEFLQRWRDMQGGWAVVLLSPSPPPYKNRPSNFSIEQCPGGSCGGGNRLIPSFPFPSPAIPEPDFGSVPSGYYWVGPLNDKGTKWWKLMKGKETVGGWWGNKFYKHSGPGERYEVKESECPIDPPVAREKEEKKEEPAKEEKVENYGVDLGKLAHERLYIKNGLKVSRESALDAIRGDGVTDDRSRHHLTFVGDASYLAKAKSIFDQLPVDKREKFRVQFYQPGDWAVSQFSLPLGVSVRKPAESRVGAEVVADPMSDLTLELLLKLIDSVFNPTPTPGPNPGPNPLPSIPASVPTWVVLLGAFLFLLSRKKVEKK